VRGNNETGSKTCNDADLPSDSGGLGEGGSSGAAGHGKDEISRRSGGDRGVREGKRRGWTHRGIVIPGTKMAYSVTEVAKLLGVSRNFVYTLIADGRLKGRQLSGRVTRILYHDLADFLRDCDILGGRAA